MTILFENGKELRKELTHAIGEILAVKPEYQGPPSFAYKVGDYMVNRDGEVETDEFTDTKAVGQLVSDFAPRALRRLVMTGKFQRNHRRRNS